MLVDKKLNEFLDELASSSPAPGGGSVSALLGALSSALTSMVCKLTEGKKGYENVSEDIRKVLEESEKIRKKTTDLIDEDSEVFNGFMAAYKTPKEFKQTLNDENYIITLDHPWNLVYQDGDVLTEDLSIPDNYRAIILTAISNGGIPVQAIDLDMYKN